MNILKSASAFFGLSNDQTDESHQLMETKFSAHVAQFGLSFGTEAEYNFRLEQFALKDQLIEETNSEQDSYWLAHNMFSTMTDMEYKRMLSRKPSAQNESMVVELDTDESPASVDWRTKGAVNPVQDQGQCGSCWAFSSTAAMEGAHFLKTGKLLKLSEQQFVDCDPQSDGCDGGLEMYAFEYAKKNAQELEKNYPYTGKTGRKCKATKSEELVEATSYAAVPKKSSAQLKAAVALQPTCVSVDASSSKWQMYSGGIYTDKKKTTARDLDHAVTAVGYGSENGQDYWIVRNSWTASWGEEGYIRIADNGDGSGIDGILLDSTRPSTN
jgi:C1A family cysteine protease